MKKPQFGRCWYCGVELGQPSSAIHPRMLVREHKIPRSRGGTDNPDNIVRACYECNAQKGRKNVEEYRARLRYFNHGITPFSSEQLLFLRLNGFDIEKVLGPMPIFYGEQHREGYDI